jgi:hypothetical protein
MKNTARAADPGGPDAERREHEEDERKRQAHEADADEGGKREERGRGVAPDMHRHLEPHAEEQSRRCRRDAGEGAAHRGKIAELRIERRRHEDETEGHQHEAAEGGNGAAPAMKPCPDIDREIADIGPRQDLAEAERLHEFLLGHPAPLVDDHAMRQGDDAAEARQTDLHEAQEQLADARRPGRRWPHLHRPIQLNSRRLRRLAP